MNIEEYISSGIIESYILGLASPEEAGILECVMKNNAEVRTAFEEAQKVLEDLATAQAVTPPSDLKSKIWSKIQQEQIVENEKPAISEQSDLKIGEITQEVYPSKAINWQKYAIAASVLFLVSIIGNFFWINDIAENKKEIAELKTQKQSQNLALQSLQQKLDIISDPNVQTVALKGVEKHPDSKALVYWNKESKEVYLNAKNLPKTPEGMQYQLWAIVDDKPVSAGMYSEDKDSQIVLSKIEKPQAFAITLEKQGGSDVPTMANMFVIGNI